MNLGSKPVSTFLDSRTIPSGNIRNKAVGRHTFQNTLNKLSEETIFVIGDFGIHTSFICMQKGNLKIIGSGLGKDNEEILIYSNNEFYRYLF